MNLLAQSRVVIRGLDRHGREISRQVSRNTLTYAMADILMNAFLRSGPSQVTHLYARFGDSSANPGWLNPPNIDLKATTRSTFVTVAPGDTVRGGLWVPVMSAPAQDTTDVTTYGGNEATFFFRIPANIPQDGANPQVEPANFVADGSSSQSYIYALGLAVAQNIQNRTQDTIISVLEAVGWNVAAPFSGSDGSIGDFAAFPIPAGGQMAVDYTVPFVVAPQPPYSPYSPYSPPT